jgi:hypothetical protein
MPVVCTYQHAKLIFSHLCFPLGSVFERESSAFVATDENPVHPKFRKKIDTFEVEDEIMLLQLLAVDGKGLCVPDILMAMFIMDAAQ